ncbi:RNA polymerase sigma factor [Flavobacterium sp. HSC-61S13]|uniref:RNA polymerase sigma factor n=1 Tax=Flavobacterium sp. HSC-61S13 TaxID=2910963 RepID=UPI00209E410F|nr:sigma-70 family RNA polymerase sigma factor [Flavobacterium sp. HSC-61S13]MCP1996832.1 RNA polymerase sigma-70 factor (ECF subfamily) [Flavobacterium sp. HSC-61S13]
MDNRNHQNIDSLITLCKLGNANAQFEIYNQFNKAMYSIALKIVNDKVLVEDILQESFLKAFMSLHAFKNEATFGTWLKKIVMNESIDILKKRNKIILEDINNVLNTLIDENSKDSYHIDQENNQNKSNQLLDVLYTLKGKNKIIMILYYVKGYNKQEICEIMNITIQNFHTIHFRAKNELRRKLYDPKPTKKRHKNQHKKQV